MYKPLALMLACAWTALCIVYSNRAMPRGLHWLSLGLGFVFLWSLAL